jgi:hypothetical protein
VESTRAFTPVSRSRRRLVTAIVAVLILGHLVAAVSGQKLWPFDPWALYAKLYVGEHHYEPVLRGVRPDGTEVAITSEHFRPVDAGRLRRMLWGDFPWVDGAIDVSRLPHWLDVYERRRTQGRHAGPEIVGIRLYRAMSLFPPTSESLATRPQEFFFRGQYFPPDVTPTSFPDDPRLRDLPDEEARR